MEREKRKARRLFRRSGKSLRNCIWRSVDPRAGLRLRGRWVGCFDSLWNENRMIETPPARGWVLYDGDCDFCIRWLRLWSPVLHRHGFEIATLQSNWVPAALGMTPGEAVRDIRLLMADGLSCFGADVYLQVARRIWWAWPFGALFSLPGLNSLIWVGYRWFAANRQCVSGLCSRRT